jgi:hypothetical protein
VFYIVQNARKNAPKRKPTKISGEPPLFSGIAYCGDCGGKMYQNRFSSWEKKQHYLICSTYSRKTGKCCVTHYIRNAVLEEIVLKNLREATAYISRFEDEFIRAATATEMREQNGNLAKKKKTLADTGTRIVEIDNLIAHLYEDNVSGKLSDERFVKLSGDYEREQGRLKKLAGSISQELKEQERARVGVKDFIGVAKKYTDLKELDVAMLREFIERINVFHMDKKTKTQKVEIIYNFIGAFDFEGFGRTAILSKRTKNQIPKQKVV